MAQADLRRGEIRDDALLQDASMRRPRERIVARGVRLLRSPRLAARLFRQLVAPLVVAVVPLYWVVDATYRATLTTIGRDQGIFQYIAWAVRTGAVDYRDVRDVNGPLVHFIHLAMLWLGGGEEHRFHVLEAAATSISFAIAGALLPGIVARKRPGVLERIGWSLATWVVLAGQYALYLYWNQAQRESFADWFLLPSLALQVMRPSRDPRKQAWRVGLVSALSTITWFAKPSFAVFTVLQAAVLMLAPGMPRRAAIRSFLLGGLAGAAIPVLYLVRYGDVGAFLHITLRDVPQVYRYMWARSAQEILGDEGPLNVATMGLAASALVVALVFARELPARTLALGLAPVAALTGAIAQHKGFGYHFHPLTATTHMVFVVVVIMLWERFRAEPRRRRLGRFLAFASATALGLFVASSMRGSPHTRAVWILAGGETEEKRNEQEYFDNFKSYDFFPWDLRQGARYLDDVTSEDARVQVYGMDPYILFLARRHSATPYIYAYDLNDDAALDGGWSNRPTQAEQDHIKAVRDAHEQDMLSRLGRAPPEAFVFIDHAPLMSYPDAWEDFRHCCSESALFVAQHYHPARTLGEVHVWLRDDMQVPDAEGLP